VKVGHTGQIGALGGDDVVALGAREVEDPLGLLFLRVEFVFDGGEGAEKEVAGVGHDGAATGRDLVGGEEFVEFAEDVVDVRGGMELLDAADQRFGEVAGVLFEANGGVAKAKAGLGVGDSHAAAASTGSAGGAMRHGGFGFSEYGRFIFHGSFPFRIGAFHFGKNLRTPWQF